MAADETLLLQLLHDDKTRETAFSGLVAQYKQPLYWQIRRMVVRHEDADDVLQNTFLKAWTGLDSFRGQSKVSTWLYRIAYNETLNFLERQKMPTQSVDDTTANFLQSDPYFDGDETQRQLQQAIATLPPKQRQVFLMKYYEEQKYEEMSEILGTSVGALKATYHFAVKKITDFFNALE
ncbi:MAG: sigma-70 family RNA polymerase sigma factor [Bacteroidaceae bacterium]|nr:sigma-70 family RNA polymerase sigma factor [Bacteroidaceae bacterium]